MAQPSVARRWNEVALAAIRQDFARPPVQARNLFHFSVAVYDAWAAYDQGATTYLLSKTVGGVTYPFLGAPAVIDTIAAEEMAISYAAFRILRHCFANSPNVGISYYRFDTLMVNLGYDTNYISTNYLTGTPADLGNYVAQQVIAWGLADGSNEAGNFAALHYAPVNTPLVVFQPGNMGMAFPNRWQQLTVPSALDQGGNPIPSTPAFIGPEWGGVLPFSLTSADLTTYTRDGGNYSVYKDPGAPPMLNVTDVNDSLSQVFKWGHAMVSIWSSHLDPADTTMMDSSPASLGNVDIAPSSFTQLQQYYRFLEGGDTSHGYSLNPVTGLPYTPQPIKRGDYTRVVSQFWADGPRSETPPGHWFVLFNNVSDHPLTVKQMEGTGPVLSDLEWDVKGYFMLGGAMHDAAIAAWGVKGWYDSPRPISMIRKMADYGQCSDSLAPHYHPGGLPLIPGYIELIGSGDSLAGSFDEHLNKIKLFTWRGFNYITDSSTDVSGVGWIRAEDWMPYQRKTFVTPPFAGYVSGHSTYSRTAAEVMTLMTGTPYFPGGLSEYVIPANNNFLVIEKGPSTDVHLQWATYRDASNQASLSRIWGGIHPPIDDMPGRLMGEQIGTEAYYKAKSYFLGLPLPLSLNYFHLSEQNCTVTLNWSTLSEEGIREFEIWRSEDGSHYTTLVATIKSKGNSQEKQYYSAKDLSPSKNNIYKLIEKDVEGRTALVGIQSIYLNQCGDGVTEPSVTWFPNPVTDVLQLTMQTVHSDEKAKISITDMSGRKVYEEYQDLKTPRTTSGIRVSDFPNATYMISVEYSDGFRYGGKFIKGK